MINCEWKLKGKWSKIENFSSVNYVQQSINLVLIERGGVLCTGILAILAPVMLSSICERRGEVKVHPLNCEHNQREICTLYNVPTIICMDFLCKNCMKM